MATPLRSTGIKLCTTNSLVEEIQSLLDPNRLASDEEYTPYVNGKIKANWLRQDLMKLFYDHMQGRFHVKTSRGIKCSSSGGRT